MGYQELKDAALPDLALLALDKSAKFQERLKAIESLATRASEATDEWCGYTAAERANVCAAFALESDCERVYDLCTQIIKS